jgi:hypothetical protein
MINFIIDILWLSSALAVFSCIVLFILSPLYEFWMINKGNIDTESELYKSVLEAVDKAEGQSIQVQLVIGEEDVSGDKEVA